ncbi:uracil-xanthine permease family protein [Tepidibacter aestuarii]|uniref:uracil-xanthine permease family protein n=1 Tax=Tepidibacter aestuarii TaxID=2925782 RepID=UPI0020BFE2C5|nr:uracil-xanthine permease family protein [Tepidibacter aestuarii]
MKKAILAIQHLFAMFGATVLVPILTGFDPSVALVSAGLGTLIFHLVTKGMVPVFLGSSFAFIPVIITVKELYNGDLAYAQGGIIVAGMIYILMSLIVKTVGIEKVKKYFPAQVTGPMIVVIGLNLIPVAFGMASGNFIVAIATLSTALLITLFAKGFIKQLSILIAVATGYILSLSLGLIDTNIIKEASWVMVPNFTLPKFDIGAIAIIAPVVLAVFMEHIGDVTTNGAVVGKDFIKNPGLNRTLIGDGLATIVGGFIGGPANTTYGENTGVLAITKNYDPSILRITAVFAITLGCISKVGIVLRTIPTPVMGGISLMLFSMIAIIGVKTVKNSDIEFKASNLITMGSILIIGFGTNYLQGKGISIGIPVTETVKITGLSLAAIVGIVLNRVLNRNSI